MPIAPPLDRDELKARFFPGHFDCFRVDYRSASLSINDGQGFAFKKISN